MKDALSRLDARMHVFHLSTEPSMSAIVRAAAVLLDASYQTDDTSKADVWREVAVQARQEYDRLRAELDKAKANRAVRP